nr:hypothetical protein [Pseudonocardia sp. ICBG601]
MNFLPATVSGSTLETPFGPIELDAARAEKSPVATWCWWGSAAEYFEDASLVDEAKKHVGSTFTAKVDVTEWLGDSQYAYIPYEAPAEVETKLKELSRELDADQLRTQAIVSIDSTAGSGRAATPSSGWTRGRSTCSTRSRARTSPATPRPAPS